MFNQTRFINNNSKSALVKIIENTNSIRIQTNNTDTRVVDINITNDLKC